MLDELIDLLDYVIEIVWSFIGSAERLSGKIVNICCGISAALVTIIIAKIMVMI